MDFVIFLAICIGAYFGIEYSVCRKRKSIG